MTDKTPPSSRQCQHSLPPHAAPLPQYPAGVRATATEVQPETSAVGPQPWKPAARTSTPAGRSTKRSRVRVARAGYLNPSPAPASYSTAFLLAPRLRQTRCPFENERESDRVAVGK